MIDKEQVSAFIQSHLKTLVLAVSGVLILLIFVLIISITSARNAEKRRQEEAARLKSMVIPPEEFFLPPEPLQIPGVQLSRESGLKWTEEEVTGWYILPSEDDLDGLRSIGDNAVENLLETVP